MVDKVKKLGSLAFVLCLVIIGGLGAYNLYMKSSSKTDKVPGTKEEILLEKDMETGYPELPSAVVELFCRYNVSLYNKGDDLSTEDFNQMVGKMRQLYCEELANRNPVEQMAQHVREQREEFKKDKQVILEYIVDSNSQVSYQTIKNQDFAFLNAKYKMKNEDTVGIGSNSQYILIKEKGKWKIYGFRKKPATTSKESKDK